jgi:coenzyme F420-reducing hydrogenase delta subunit
MAFKRTAVSYGAAVEAKREAQLKKLYDDIAKINERLANPDISAEERLRLTEERKKKARAIQSLGGTVSPEWTQ